MKISKEKTGNSNKNKSKKYIQPKTSKKEIRHPKTNLIAACVIFLCSFCIYANSIRNNYALDDDMICLKNKFVQNKLNNVKEIFTYGYSYAFNGINTDTYRPITLLSAAIEVSLFGNNPHRHHLINVLLFSLSCVVLFLLLRKMFSRYNLILPLIITLLYSAHPIHTEVVANIKSRDEILCFMFFVFSLYLMMSYFNKKNIVVLLGSCICYLLSLLSKETAMTFFILFPMVIYYFTDTNFKKAVLFFIPYFIVLMIYILIRDAVINSVTFTTKIDIVNNSLMGTQNYFDRMATAFSMLGKYISLLIFPVTLACDYSYNSIPIINWGNPKAFLSLLLYLGVLVYAIITIRRKNYFSFAILFFIITLSTASNIFKIIGSSMAERFLYAPSLGFCFIIGLALVKLFKVDLTGNKKTGLKPVTLIVGIIFILYSFKTIDRNVDWKDNEHLYETDVKSYPDNYRLHAAFGGTFREKGEAEKDPLSRNKLFAKAIIEYDKSLAILPQQPDTWYNIGVSYYALKDFSNATNAYDRCLKFDSTYKLAYYNLGVIFYEKNNYDTAYYFFTKTIQFDPRNADAILNAGAVMQTKGKFDEAVKYYERSLEIRPDNPNVYTNLIRIYEYTNDPVKVDYYKKKLQSLNL